MDSVEYLQEEVDKYKEQVRKLSIELAKAHDDLSFLKETIHQHKASMYELLVKLTKVEV